MTKLRGLLWFGLSLAIVAGVAAGGFRLAMHLAPEYRQSLVAVLERELQAQVDIADLRLGWEGFGPALALREVRLQAADNDPVQVQGLTIGFHPWELVQGKIRPRRLTVTGAALILCNETGQWRVLGLPGGGNTPPSLDDMLEALDEFSQLRIRDSSLRLQSTAHGPAITVWTIDEARLAGGLGPRRALLRLHDAQGGRLELRSRFADAQPQMLEWEFRDIQLDALKSLDPRLNTIPGGEVYVLEGRADREWENGRSSWPFQGQLRAALRSTADGPLDLRTQGPLRGRFSADRLRIESEAWVVETGTRAWPTQALWVEYLLGERPRLRLQAGWLQLDDLFPMLAPWLPEQAPLQGLQGALSDVRLDWAVGTPRPALVAQLSGLGLRWGEQWAIEGVDGEVSSSGQRGRISINSRDLQLEWPAVLSGVTEMESLAGTMEWSWDDQGLQWNVPDLAYSVSAIDGVGRLSQEAGERWQVDLRFLCPDVRVARNLIPLIWPQTLQEWLSEAAQGGELREGRVHLNGQGSALQRTEVDLELDAVTLQFAPGWDLLNAEQAQVQIRDKSVQVSVPRGTLRELQIENVQARVAPQPAGLLTIDAGIRGDAGRVLQLLGESPVAENVREVRRSLSLAGPVRGDLDLVVDLRKQGRGRWSAQVDVDGATLQLHDWPTPIRNIRGALNISPEGLQASALQADMLGWPIQARLSRSAGRTRLRATTRAQMADIPADWPLPAWLPPRLEGAADWIIEGQFGADTQTDLSVRSDLKGAAVRLPPPLEKTADSARRLLLKVQPGQQRLQVAYGDLLAVHGLNLGQPDARLALRFGADEVAASPAAGVWVDGELASLPMEPWLDFLPELQDSATESDGEAATTDQFGGLSLRLGALELGGQSWPQTDLQVLRSGANWLVNLRGDSLRGQMLVTPERGQDQDLVIAGQFEQVDWALSSATVAATSEASTFTLELPAALPTMDLRVARFRLDGEDLGPLTMGVVSESWGYRIDTLRVGSDAAPTLRLSGRVLDPQRAAGTQWEQAQNTLQFALNTDNAMPWLRAMGYAGRIRAQRMRLDGALAWATPEDLAALRVDGDFQFNLGDGRLVSVEPGAGRLLGLLSVTALPRRFLLDFSDVTDSGLGFDTLEGSYALNQGQAITDDLRIISPSLRMMARGEVDLVQRLQDQQVTILPGISHGFTAAATVLGGPAMGLFLLLAQELLDKPLDQVGQIAYRIQGPLDNPTVEPVQ